MDEKSNVLCLTWRCMGYPVGCDVGVGALSRDKKLTMQCFRPALYSHAEVLAYYHGTVPSAEQATLALGSVVMEQKLNCH